jgi:murein DD-endopeptidase MepM/ murein hydrolase activator NlpD
MTEPPFTEPLTGGQPASSPRLSRRRLLTIAGAVGGYAMFHADHLLAQAPLSGDVMSLEEPATALAQAERLDLTSQFDPPAPGEILFPIIVGPEDSCYVSNSFGDCRGSGCSRSHEGVDIMADEGLPIRATVSGRLTYRYVDSGLTSGAGNGWTLVDASTNTSWKFFHMGRHADGLDVGDEVAQGEVIGYVGNTGTSGVPSGTNYHLHLEYRPDNVAANPFDRLQRPPFVTFEP